MYCLYWRQKVNNEYKNELTKTRIIEKIIKEKDPDLKQFYIKHLEQLNNRPNKYTNEGIKQLLDGEIDKKGELISNYKENFLYEFNKKIFIS